MNMFLPHKIQVESLTAIVTVLRGGIPRRQLGQEGSPPTAGTSTAIKEQVGTPLALSHPLTICHAVTQQEAPWQMRHLDIGLPSTKTVGQRTSVH